MEPIYVMWKSLISQWMKYVRDAVSFGCPSECIRKQEDTQQPIGVFENVIIRNVKAVAADKAQRRLLPVF